MAEEKKKADKPSIPHPDPAKVGQSMSKLLSTTRKQTHPDQRPAKKGKGQTEPLKKRIWHPSRG